MRTVIHDCHSFVGNNIGYENITVILLQNSCKNCYVEGLTVLTFLRVGFSLLLGSRFSVQI